LPDLHKHFQRQRLNAEAYAVECLTSFYTANLNIRSLLRVWDLLLLRFDHVLTNVLLAVFYLNQSLLITLELEELIPQIKDCLKKAEPDDLIPLLIHPPEKPSLLDKCSIS